MEGKTHGLQIAGFVVSLTTCFIFGFYGLSGITGLVLSAVGRAQANQVGGKTGLGTAGIVYGFAYSSAEITRIKGTITILK